MRCFFFLFLFNDAFTQMKTSSELASPEEGGKEGHMEDKAGNPANSPPPLLPENYTVSSKNLISELA